MSFLQTFVPAGFDEGDSESGRVALGLPGCVRWDYSEPYPKSYLLCGTDLHAWNPGETVGQLYALDETRPGLDLFLLDREALQTTYAARSRRSPEGITVHLRPREPSSRALAQVRIRVTEGADRILELSYRDGDGNRTVFEFGPPRSVDDPNLFLPPGEVEWLRETP
ncbi:MAG: outer membrane lipoprotein carrier protein LolA [Thermoanaerobaculia bacterium]|nr:outer membrane lipoprotein carrier protein LolA [Thermoanaerobaculia bacterium]